MKKEIKNHFLSYFTLLLLSLFISCEKKITAPSNQYESPPSNNPSPKKYENVTGTWKLSTRIDFSNNNFKGSLSTNLNLTQTKEILYQDVYKVNGTFSDFVMGLQRKSDGALYLIAQGGYGDILDGGINPNDGPPRIAFYLGSQKLYVRGVTLNYESMWGDITVQVNLGPSDGTVTLTGTWDANRK